MSIEVDPVMAVLARRRPDDPKGGMPIKLAVQVLDRVLKTRGNQRLAELIEDL